MIKEESFLDDTAGCLSKKDFFNFMMLFKDYLIIDIL